MSATLSQFTQDFQALLNALPGLHLIISPDHTILGANRHYLRVLRKEPADLLGRHFSVIWASGKPDFAPELAREWEASLNYVLTHKEPHTMAPHHYEVQDEETGNWQVRHWQLTHVPVLDEQGEVQYILNETKDITESYLADLRIREKEVLYQMVSLATNDAIWDLNLRDNTARWNANYTSLFGHDNPAAAITSWSDFLHPDDKERVESGIQRVLDAGDKFWSDEYRFRCADGSYSEVMDRGYILYGEDGQPERMVGCMQDVTLQKETQHKLQEHGEFFRFLASSIPSFIWTSDPDGKTDYRNEYYLQFIDQEVARKGQFVWSELLPPDQKDYYLNKWREGLQSGQPFEQEIPIRSHNGEYRWVLARANPKYDEQGQLVKWLGTATDIHAQKLNQLALEESIRSFKFLSDTIPSFIWTSNSAGDTEYRNQHYYEYVGKAAAEDPDFDWRDVLHPDDREKTSFQWQESVSSGRNFEIEHRLKSEAGTYRWFLSRATPMLDDTGKVLKWFGISFDIHEQKQVQEQILERDNQLQRMLNNAPIVFFVLRGPELRVSFTNPNFNRLYNNRQFLGQAARRAWPELAQQGILGLMEQVYSSGTPYTNPELPVKYDRLGNGQLDSGFFHVHFQPLVNKDDQIDGVLCYAVEVTEQVLAKHEAEALAKRLGLETEKFRFLADSMPQLVWSADPNGQADYLNQGLQEYAGFPPAGALEMAWEEVVHPDDRQRALDRWSLSVQNQIPYEIEYRLRRADGTYRWHLARAVPMRDPEGQVIKWFGTCTDIDDHKRIQSQLEESIQRFQFLAEAMPQKVWTALPDGKPNYYNQHWVVYSGLSQEQLLADGLHPLLHPEDQETIRQVRQASLTSSSSFQFEVRLRDAAGDYRWHLGRGLPMRNDQGEVLMWVGTYTDIHEQKMAQQQLLEANLELRKINEDLDRFVYTASHDLKLPIINMGGIFDELMRSCAFQDPEQEQLAQMFYKALAQINATISDLSEIAKVQKNLSNTAESVVLTDLTDEILFSLQDQVKQNRARVHLYFEEVPVLHFSRADLRSVLYNLITNALKYRAPEREPLITLKTWSEGDYHVLAVQDNGLGLDLPEHRDKLFQMFKRFHTHVPGTGLGLYIINRIMQNNKGFVQVDSNLNEGTTFRIYFKRS